MEYGILFLYWFYCRFKSIRLQNFLFKPYGWGQWPKSMAVYKVFLNLSPGNQTTCLFNYTSLSCGHSVESMIYACFKPRHYPGRSYKIGYVVGAYPPSKYLHLLELPLSNTLLMYFYSSIHLCIINLLNRSMGWGQIRLYKEKYV